MAEKVRKIEEMSEVEEPGQKGIKTDQRKKKKIKPNRSSEPDRLVHLNRPLKTLPLLTFSLFFALSLPDLPSSSSFPLKPELAFDALPRTFESPWPSSLYLIIFLSPPAHQPRNHPTQETTKPSEKNQPTVSPFPSSHSTTYTLLLVYILTILIHRPRTPPIDGQKSRWVRV